MAGKFNAAFWKWFGQSKVIDGNGHPVVVYHATGAATHFTAFKRRLGDIGIHFGTLGQAEDRMDYMQEKRPGESWRVIPVYLSIQNPARMTDHGAWNADNLEYTVIDRFGIEAWKKIQREAYTANAKLAAIRDLLVARGFDGIVYKNTGETAGVVELRRAERRAHAALPKGILSSTSPDAQHDPAYRAWRAAFDAYERFRYEHQEDSWIAFFPEQIKSAVGNSGAWDPRSKDIRSNPPLERQAERLIRRLA